MRLLRIDTNKGNRVDGGFRHTVFESSITNGKRSIKNLCSTKFDGILYDAEHIEHFKKNPDEFLGGITSDDTNNSQPNADSTDGGDAA